MLNLFFYIYFYVVLFNTFFRLFSSFNGVFNSIKLNISKFFDSTPFFVSLKVLPNSDWYKPFKLNLKHATNSGLNYSKEYFVSLYIYLKGLLVYSVTSTFFKSSSTLLNSLIFFRNPIWKPLFKKTSYYGLYTAYKNKY